MFEYVFTKRRYPISLDNKEYCLKCLQAPEDNSPEQYQLGFVCASQRLFFEELEDNDELMEIIGAWGCGCGCGWGWGVFPFEADLRYGSTVNCLHSP